MATFVSVICSAACVTSLSACQRDKKETPVLTEVLTAKFRLKSEQLDRCAVQRARGTLKMTELWELRFRGAARSGFTLLPVALCNGGHA